MWLRMTDRQGPYQTFLYFLVWRNEYLDADRTDVSLELLLSVMVMVTGQDDLEPNVFYVDQNLGIAWEWEMDQDNRLSVIKVHHTIV